MCYARGCQRCAIWSEWCHVSTDNGLYGVYAFDMCYCYYKVAIWKYKLNAERTSRKLVQKQKLHHITVTYIDGFKTVIISAYIYPTVNSTLPNPSPILHYGILSITSSLYDIIYVYIVFLFSMDILSNYVTLMSCKLSVTCTITNPYLHDNVT